MGSCVAREDDLDLDGASQPVKGPSADPSMKKAQNHSQPTKTSGDGSRMSVFKSSAFVMIIPAVVSYAVPSHKLLVPAVFLTCVAWLWWWQAPSFADRPVQDISEIYKGVTNAADSSFRRGTDASLPCYRLQDEEAAKIRARGEDPYVSQRLNYLQGTTVPFEPLLIELNDKQKKRFSYFERVFPSVLDADTRLNRKKFYQQPDRFMMLLFLQADNYDVDLGVARLVDTIVWRQEFGVDDFIDNPDWKLYNHFLKYRPKRILGLDKSGRPLICERLGEFFGSDNGERAMPRELWTRCHAFELSLIGAAFRMSSIRENRAIHRLNYLGDLSNIRFRQASGLLNFLNYITSGVERYYPETAGIVVMSSAPSFFGWLWGVVRLFIDKKIEANMKVHTGIPAAQLREYFGPEVLPQEFGGHLAYSLPHVTDLPS